MDIAVQRALFIRFLDRNYCIAAHLSERLDELRESNLFLRLQGQIAEAVGLLEEQSFAVDKFYRLLGTAVAFKANGPVISFLEHAFSCLPGKDDGTQFACLLDYVSVADVLLAESAKLAAVYLRGLDLPEPVLYRSIILEPLINALAQIGYVSV